MNKTFIIKEVSFQKVKDIWENYLWPGRESAINPVSTMTYLGGYDMSIKKVKAHFFACYFNKQIIGVNSTFPTSQDSYRFRGLYVQPQYRGKGVSKLLFEECQNIATANNAQFIWSLPRKSALNVYCKFGFEVTSDWITDGVEFGPNVYVKKNL